MDPLTQASHSRHWTLTDSMKSHHGQATEVIMRESSGVRDNLPVPDSILQDLSLLINDEWLDVGKCLNIPDESLPKIQTDYGTCQKKATYKMLLGWKKKIGQQATYSVLGEALTKAGRGDLAELLTELIELQERELMMNDALPSHEIEDFHPLWRKKRTLRMQLKESNESDLLKKTKAELQRDLDDIEEHELLMEEKNTWWWEFYERDIGDLIEEKKEELLSKVDGIEELELLIEENTARWWELYEREPFEERKEELLGELDEIAEYEQLMEDKNKCREELCVKDGRDHEKIAELQRELDEMDKLQLLMEEQFKCEWGLQEIGETESVTRNKVLWGLQDKISHFIRCLKAKYTSWLKSMKGTPWMKSGKCEVEDLFVDVGLQLFNPSQSTMSESSWQPLDSVHALFTHPDLRSAHFISVEGESGSGKTVLLYQMVHSWCMSDVTENFNVFILLPCRFIQEHNSEDSLYMTIKKFLFPRSTFLTINDVRDILTRGKSVLALDDSLPEVVNGILGENSDDDCFTLLSNSFVYHSCVEGIREQILDGNLQLICSSSNTTDSLRIQHFSHKRVKPPECHKMQKLYLQQLLPNDEWKHEIILKLLSENPALATICENHLCYVMLVHLLKDDLAFGKDEKIEHLSQFFKYIVEYLTNNIDTKQVENRRKSETTDYHVDISAFAHRHLLEYSELIEYEEVIDKQMWTDVGILVEDHYLNDCYPPTEDTNPTPLRFCHKMFEIFFAAQYLPTSEVINFLLPKSLSKTDTTILLRFICGLNSESSAILLERLGRDWLEDNDDNDEFFLCFHEHCGSDDSLRSAMDAVCHRKREFKLSGNNHLVLKSMVRFFNLASYWKITIECIDLREHDFINVDENGLTLSNGVCLGPLSAKLIKINKWCGKQLVNFLNKCVHLVEARIFANDPRRRRHEIQREVEGMHFKVRWESNYKHERNKRKTEEVDEVVNLVDLFENLDRFSEVSLALRETFSTEMNVDARGGRLVIEEAAISLDIPPGALNEGVDISIAVVNDGGILLPYDDTPMVTRLVKCKPSGQRFLKPVTLVLPHCGILTDNKDHKVICMKSYFSGGIRQWQINTDTETALSKRDCSLRLTNFCFHCCSISGLESKIMRAFILKKKTEVALSVKLWICNGNPSVFANILNVERDDGYQQMGAHQEFVLYKNLGDVATKCREIEMQISLAHIWHGSGRCTMFYIPFDCGDIGETLHAKQIGEKEAGCLYFFIDEKAPDKRRKRKKSSTIHEQSEALISAPRSSESKVVIQVVPNDERLGQAVRPDLSGSSRTVSMPQGSRQLKDFNAIDVVSESAVAKLSGLLTTEWEALGRELGLLDAQLQNIKSDHKGNEKEMKYQMLLSWKWGNGSEATYGCLFVGLKNVNRRDLVEVRKEREKWVNT